MDPIDVLKTVWRYRYYALPAVAVTLAAATYVLWFGPRSFESTTSYAIVSPSPPTEAEIAKDPRLGSLNANNPYLRSPDQSLITRVEVIRLSDPGVGAELLRRGQSADYRVTLGGNGTGFLIDITGVAPEPRTAQRTAAAIGRILDRDLTAVQTINGADERYLFTALQVSPPTPAHEQFSSRLRAVIIVLLGGAMLMFGAVSLGRWVDELRSRHGRRGRPPSGAQEEPTAPARRLRPGPRRESGPSDGPQRGLTGSRKARGGQPGSDDASDDDRPLRVATPSSEDPRGE